MPITIAEYERELAESKAELQDVQDQMQALAAREAELTKVVQGWQAIIASKRKQSGDYSAPQAPSAELDAPAETFQLIEDQEEEGENKTQFVREYVLRCSSAGTTPEELKRAAKAAGMTHPPSWPYGPLQRLKKKGEIVKRRGRFYPNTQSNTGNQSLALVG